MSTAFIFAWTIYAALAASVCVVYRHRGHR
jgi:hypothetical protein